MLELIKKIINWLFPLIKTGKKQKSMKQLFKVKRVFIKDLDGFEYWTPELPEGVKTWGQADDSLEKKGYVIIWAEVDTTQKAEILKQKDAKFIGEIKKEMNTEKDEKEFIEEYQATIKTFLEEESSK